MIFKRNNAFSLYDLYGHTLAQESCPGAHESYNFGRLSFDHHYYILNLYDLCLGLKMKIFKEIMHSLPYMHVLLYLHHDFKEFECNEA